MPKNYVKGEIMQKFGVFLDRQLNANFSFLEERYAQ